MRDFVKTTFFLIALFLFNNASFSPVNAVESATNLDFKDRVGDANIGFDILSVHLDTSGAAGIYGEVKLAFPAHYSSDSDYFVGLSFDTDGDLEYDYYFGSDAVLWAANGQDSNCALFWKRWKDHDKTRTVTFFVSKTCLQFSKQVGVAVDSFIDNVGQDDLWNEIGTSPFLLTTIPDPEIREQSQPLIGGSSAVFSELTSDTGSWDEGVRLDLQWLRDGVAISGQTSGSYVSQIIDIGKSISLRVQASKQGYATVVLESAAVTIKAADLSKSPKPSISGKTKVGQTLKAESSKWDSGVKLTYQWFRNGVAIKGATKSSYKLVKADKGKTITVAVTGTKAGYTTVTRTSSGKKVTS